MNDELDELLRQRARGSSRPTRFQQIEAWFIGGLIALTIALPVIQLGRAIWRATHPI